MKRKVMRRLRRAVATSTMAAEEIKELCADHNIELDLVQCRVNEIETYMDGADLDLHPPRAWNGPSATFRWCTACHSSRASALKPYNRKSSASSRSKRHV